jgi:Glucoamylase and related glycosyl hydrolases
LAAADLADLAGEETVAAYLRETADTWYANLDSWIYATDTPLAREVGVDGYYVRVATPDVSDASSPLGGFVAIKNRPPSEMNHHAADIVSPDALALVRFGLRSGNDPRIVNTVKVIDEVLRIQLPHGPGWRRYNHDGYGEKADGSPFDGTGIGRVWPLLAGERAHYELAAGNREAAEKLLQTLEDSASDGGLIPEQSWDSADFPERELYFGRPAGSAMPLVWAHSEHLKLLRSLRDGRIFDLPPQTVARYLDQPLPRPPHEVWRFNHKIREAQADRPLRIEALAPTRVRWSMVQLEDVPRHAELRHRARHAHCRLADRD